MSLLRTIKRGGGMHCSHQHSKGDTYGLPFLCSNVRNWPHFIQVHFQRKKESGTGKIGFVKDGFSFLQLKQQQRRRWIVSSRPDISVSFSSQHTIFCTQTKNVENAYRYFPGERPRRKNCAAGYPSSGEEKKPGGCEFPFQRDILLSLFLLFPSCLDLENSPGISFSAK